MKESFEAKLHKDRDYIVKFCQKFDRVHLFGAGAVAKKMIRYLEIEGIQISDVVVSIGKKERETIEGYKIIDIAESQITDKDGYIVCVGAKSSYEIWTELISHGVRSENIIVQKIYYQALSGKPNNGLVLEHTRSDIKKGYFSDFTELDNLGMKYGTDKSSGEHDYCNKYEFFLERFRMQSFALLELGVLNGASIKMWGEYFCNAKIYGVDIDKRCIEYKGENREILIRNIEERETIEELKSIRPTIIVDDASHKWMDQLYAFYNLFFSLPAGGVYILEDIHTSFGMYKYSGYDNACISAYDFIAAVASVVTGGTCLSDNNVAILYQFKDEIERVAREIEMISFINSSCIIIRR